MHVRDLMTAEPVTVSPADRIVEAQELMGICGFRHIPVIDPQGALVGMLSRVDITRVAYEGGGSDPRARAMQLAKLTVAEVMVKRVDTVSPDEVLGEVARTMRGTRRACLPVVENGKLVGILTEADFVRMVSALLPDNTVPAWMDILKKRLADARG